MSEINSTECSAVLPIAANSCLAAALASRAAMLGADSSTTDAPTLCATARTSVALPTPSGPLIRTPSWADAPSWANSSGRWKVRLSHSVSSLAWSCWPTRSATGTGGTWGTWGTSTGTTTGSGSGSSTTISVPRQVSTLLGPIVTGPTGCVAVTVISSLVHVVPMASDSCRRACDTSAPGGGARSWGSSDTASPVVRTLPVRASRSVSGCTEAEASREPVTTMDRAADTSTGATTISEPSTMPRLDSVTSST